MKHLTPAGKDAAAHAKKVEAAQLRLYLEARGGSIALVATDLGVHRDAVHKQIVACGLQPWLTETYPPRTGARIGHGKGPAAKEWTEREIKRLRRALVRAGGVVVRAAADLGMPESTLTYQVGTSGLAPWLAAAYPARSDKSSGSAAAVDCDNSQLDDTTKRRMLHL